ncbi:MAG: hypothetical protein R2911_33925 [Caldilineaceae bacterium]
MLLWLVFMLTACGRGDTSDASAATSGPTATPTELAVANIEPKQEDSAMIRYETLTLQNGTEIEYAIVLPDKFDESQIYPILLALPPGGQTRDMVDAGLGYWADGAMAHGWIVLSPTAPNGELFFMGSEQLIPEFLQLTAARYKPEGGQYHLAGISNGGISAFRIAGLHPQLFHSIIAAPGYAYSDEDKQMLTRLTNIPIALFVGENDTGWVTAMQETTATINQLGGFAALEIVPNEGHVIRSLGDGVKLYGLLESFRVWESSKSN